MQRQSAFAPAAAIIAAASGCSLERSRLAASVSTEASSKGAAGMTAITRGLPSVKVPRFIHYERIDLLETLKSFGAFDENACTGTFSDADHDRHRRCKDPAHRGRR